jgi:hypothetical protein
VAVVVGDDATDADGVPRRLVIHRITSPSELMCLVTAVLRVEPPIGVEPMTYALRVRRSNRLS